MIPLRPYQTQVKAEIKVHWLVVRYVLAVSATGSGKTVLFSDIIAEEPGASVVIAHRHELVGQVSMALARNGVRHRIIGSSELAKECSAQHMDELGVNYVDPNSRVAAASVDTLILMKGADFDAWRNSVKLWVMDECFPAGTNVSGRPIENIKVGDFVDAFNEETGLIEQRKVVRLFRNRMPEHMVSVKAGHHVLNCTPGHPFFTKRGWVDAGNLTVDDEVLEHGCEMLNVRDSSRSNRASPQPIGAHGKGILQQSVFGQVPITAVIGNDEQNEFNVRLRSDDFQQPYAQTSDSRENVSHAKGNQTPTENSGWKRSAPNTTGTNIVRPIRGLGFRPTTCDQDRPASGQRLSSLLQAGHGALGDEHSCGSRWSEPQGEAAVGCEEGRMLTWLRVDSISFYKRNDSEAARSGVCDGHVYNIEVEGLHTYIANGIVVHNCHHVLKHNKWGKAVMLFPHARGLGVTAETERADGYGLGAANDGVFEEIVVAPTMRDIINMGFLTDYRVFVPPSDLDLTQVDTGPSGEFSPKKLKKATHASHITGDIVKHYLKLASGKLGITFAVDIEEATAIAAEFRRNGVPAEVVSSKTKSAVRRNILKRFKRREILQLVNVDLFGEGFDLPAIEVVSMGRATQSFNLYKQQFGRALRLLEGKTWALIIDHVGNVLRHGLPDQKRDYNLGRPTPRAQKAPDEDVIPMRVCIECSSPYERIYPACVFCGHAPVPAERSSPAYVDGDLFELTQEVLAKMRGEANAVMQTGFIPVPPGVSSIVQRSIENKFMARANAQAGLRNTLALWAGFQKDHKGRSDSEIYRLFYLTYGTDLLTAQTLGATDAELLREKLQLTLNKHNVISC